MYLMNVSSRVEVLLPPGGKVPSRKRFLCGLVILGLCLGAVGQARSDFMYWGDTVIGDIRRANLDGTEQTILISGLPGPGMPALDLAGGWMYWSDYQGG